MRTLRGKRKKRNQQATEVVLFRMKKCQENIRVPERWFQTILVDVEIEMFGIMSTEPRLCITNQVTPNCHRMQRRARFPDTWKHYIPYRTPTIWDGESDDWHRSFTRGGVAGLDRGPKQESTCIAEPKVAKVQNSHARTALRLVDGRHPNSDAWLLSLLLLAASENAPMEEVGFADSDIDPELRSCVLFNAINGKRFAASLEFLRDRANQVRIAALSLILEFLRFIASQFFLQAKEQRDPCKQPSAFSLLDPLRSPVHVALQYLSTLVLGEGGRMRIVFGLLACQDLAQLQPSHPWVIRLL